MNGYLIAEEGPLVDTIIAFEGGEEGEEWILGRDPEAATTVLEDPMVSRKHVIVRLTPEGFVLENLSTVNPATQNGKIIVDPVLLKEGDIVQIGSTFFRFSESLPEEPEIEAPAEKEEAPSEPKFSEEELSFGIVPETRWLMKVVSGPNAGAEFVMQTGSTYTLGKDPNVCDVVFQDLSVSRQHAKLIVTEDEKVFIEDLGSRNGTIVNGELIEAKRELHSEDLIGIGTTTFVVIDRQKARETIISPSLAAIPRVEEEGKKEIKKAKDWKEFLIPKRHLILAGALALFVLICFVSMLNLFKSEPIIVKKVDESREIKEALSRFPAVEFTYNHSTGKIFLVGHVLTSVEKQELLYLLKQMAYISDIEDTVIIDEFVRENMNSLLMTNSAWQGVAIYTFEPGKFVLQGYLKTLEESEALSDYMNLNFPYLDRFDNKVVIESNLITEIQGLLFVKNFAGISFQLSNGELVLSGVADDSKSRQFHELLTTLKSISGIRVVKNYVVMTKNDTSRIDLSQNYQITGYSKKNDLDCFVVINGKILGRGDILDGMKITQIKSNQVFLEKDGLKYRINYNLQ
ncbi:MAG: type III secretion system inner membrane ring subunit SctD [Chlamydiae bacterium]|nr:type III secretion system inner membrane ring subunit SctD [Chlamydiota bacterium]